MPSNKPQLGKPYPLGSTYDGKGVNFALFSRHAQKVELCLFDKSGSQETERYEISDSNNNIWHIYLPDLKPGQVYGYRVYGPYKPTEGKRFNPNKLLIDPYGKKLVGKLIWDKAIFGYDLDSPEKDLSFNELDSAPYVPKSVVVDDAYDWEGDCPLQHSFENTILYETHTRGFTKLHPKVPDAKRGTFAGMANKSIINYLKWLGITAVELLPIHAFFGNRHKKGYIVDNYWGYESYTFFAPEQSYLSTDDINEFKDMVKTLHKNDIEVILDVVYNHTGEGNQLGPTLCYRGIDNESYYILSPENRRYYYDSTGCGASFNVSNPSVLTLVMDSLRYWVKEMHVDGFRFDLATTLSRQNHDFTQKSGFMYATLQDPLMKQSKLIAEPWDVGYGGYQVGAFLPGWAEWNDKFRDIVRRFWKGDLGQTAELASRIAGSSDVFNYNNRDLWTSVNFVTAHDGFTLNDLVSYNGKHNSSNGEGNRDGNDSNWSWNSGAEGETNNKVIKANRLARSKALMSTLLLSFGTPMMLAGDEFSQSHFGNNNPYCQDNVLSWVAWEAITEEDRGFTRFVKKLVQLRKKLKIFERRNFFSGQAINKNGVKDITWYTEKGTEFVEADWHDGNRKSLSYCVFTGNKYILCIFNADFNEQNWKMPNIDETMSWHLLLDSSSKFKETTIASNKMIKIPGWSVLLFEIKR